MNLGNELKKKKCQNINLMAKTLEQQVLQSMFFEKYKVQITVEKKFIG